MYWQASRLGMEHWQSSWAAAGAARPRRTDKEDANEAFMIVKNAVDDSKMDDANAPTVNGAMLAVIHENSKSHTRQNHLRLSWGS